MGLEDVARLVADVDADYYVDEELVRDAVRRRASFQIVQKRGFHRIDVFVKRDEPFADEQHHRRRVLQKLVCYRKGDEVSDLQWRVLGVLKVNPDLDRLYSTQWAEELGVADLLARACVEAGLGPSGAP